MERKELTEKRIREHCAAYPGLQMRDVFKFLHQSAFGCEHMVRELSGAIDYIRREYEALSCEELLKMPYTEPLDGPYCRAHLRWLRDGLSAETLGKLFFLSAAPEENGRAHLEEKLSVFLEMSKGESETEELTAGIGHWREDGFQALHHSEEFRKLYHPAYRVIKKEFARFLPLFTEIDRRLSALPEGGTLKVAVEGGSASGKTTLGALLEEIYGCTLFHMDDFFLRPEQRTKERFSEPGGNVDRERFLSEVLLPLSKGEEILYRPFDCETFMVLPGQKVTPGKLIVTEGAYSLHPELASYYDFSVFLKVEPALQRARIQKRNSPALAERFFNEWIPYEEHYFSATALSERVDLVISVDEGDVKK